MISYGVYASVIFFEDGTTWHFDGSFKRIRQSFLAILESLSAVSTLQTQEGFMIFKALAAGLLALSPIAINGQPPQPLSRRVQSTKLPNQIKAYIDKTFPGWEYLTTSGSCSSYLRKAVITGYLLVNDALISWPCPNNRQYTYWVYKNGGFNSL